MTGYNRRRTGMSGYGEYVGIGKLHLSRAGVGQSRPSLYI